MAYVELVDLTLSLEKFGLIAKHEREPIRDLSDELDWLKNRFNEVQTVPIGAFLTDLGIIAEESGLKVNLLAESFSAKGGLLDSVKTGLKDMLGGITGGKGLSGDALRIRRRHHTRDR